MGGQVSDHFQWHYNAAFAQALATTIVPTWQEFEKMESTLMRFLQKSVEGSVAILLSWIFNVLGLFVVGLGKSILVNEAKQTTRIPGPLFRFGVNVFFLGFTLPMWLITHFTYWLES